MYRGINDFKKAYQPKSNIVRDEKDDLATDSHIVLDSLRNRFTQQLNLHGVHDVRQREIHTAESLVPGPSAFEAEMAIEKLRRPK